MNQLELPLKAEWYEMIESGVKTEEYREVKPYWIKRLTERWSISDFKHFDTVRFRYGCTKRTMAFECKGITIDFGNPLWGAPLHEPVFIIRLGKRIN